MFKCVCEECIWILWTGRYEIVDCNEYNMVRHFANHCFHTNGTYFNLTENEQIGGIQYFVNSECKRWNCIHNSGRTAAVVLSIRKRSNYHVSRFRTAMQRVNDFMSFRITTRTYLILTARRYTGCCAYLETKKNSYRCAYNILLYRWRASFSSKDVKCVSRKI